MNIQHKLSVKRLIIFSNIDSAVKIKIKVLNCKIHNDTMM